MVLKPCARPPKPYTIKPCAWPPKPYTIKPWVVYESFNDFKTICKDLLNHVQ